MTRYKPASDPAFYLIAGFFACLTTLWPALMGVSWLMVSLQVIGLTAVSATAILSGGVGQQAAVTVLWLAVQAATIRAAAWIGPAAVLNAVPGGFDLRGLWLQRFHAGLEPNFGFGPDGEAVGLLLNSLLLTLGSLLTGGLTGTFVMVEQANRAALAWAVLSADVAGPQAGNAFSLAVANLRSGPALLLLGSMMAHPVFARVAWKRGREPAEDLPVRKPLLGASGLAMVGGLILWLLTAT
ncbi:MAG: hypothetical protein J4G06_00385 [Caldilineaceae bacterium]|nr:hypothetical protein [Caldilineaceae bacterium]